MSRPHRHSHRQEREREGTLQGSLRRGFAKMVRTPFHLASTTISTARSLSRDDLTGAEYEKHLREFEYLFLLFESFLLQHLATDTKHTEKGKSVKEEQDPARRTNKRKKKEKGKLKSDGEKRRSRREKSEGLENESEEESDRKNESAIEEAKATRKLKEEDEHEVRFIVGLINGYLALRRLAVDDKDLTFSSAQNKRKEEERERKEQEKLQLEVLLRIRGALIDLEVLSLAPDGTPSPAALPVTDRSAHNFKSQPISTSFSTPELSESKAGTRQSWRGKLKAKLSDKDNERSYSFDRDGKDKKPQVLPDDDAKPDKTAKRDIETSTQARENNQKDTKAEPIWTEQLLSPRTMHKRSQSLTFEPAMMLENRSSTKNPPREDSGNSPSAPLIPLAELEERLRKMEELIERSYAAPEVSSTSQSVPPDPDMKKKKRLSRGFARLRSSAGLDKHLNKIKKSSNTLEDETDKAETDSGEHEIPISIYTKVRNRRSVYQYKTEPLQEMFERESKEPSNDSQEASEREGIPTTVSEKADREKPVACVTSITITPPHSEVPAEATPKPIQLPSLKFTESDLLPTVGQEVSSPSPDHSTGLSPSPFDRSSTNFADINISDYKHDPLATRNDKCRSDNTNNRSRRCTIASGKREKMLHMRTIDRQFAVPGQNVKWAFVWCEENVPASTHSKIVKAQAFVRRYLAYRLRKRLQIANELLVTEKHYVDILDLLVNIFIRPLRQAKIASEDVIKSIFANTEFLWDKHLQFHDLLHKRVREWMTFQYFGVGDIFYDHTDFLMSYSEYVNNFDNALAVLANTKTQSEEFAKFIQLSEARPECNLHDLQSMLITPIQRIPRYNLLLLDLQRHTTIYLPRHAVLDMAIKKIRDIANQINEQKRLNDNAITMAQLESKLVFDPKPKVGLCEVESRKFIKEGKVLIQLGRKQFKGKLDHLLELISARYLTVIKSENDDEGEEESQEPKSTPAEEIEDERFMVKAYEPLNENPIEISSLPEFFVNKTKRFPLRLYFSSQRKEYRCVFLNQKERDDWLQRIVSAHASSRRRPYSLLTVRRVFTDSSRGGQS